MKDLLTAVGLAISLASTANSTDRFFPDLSVTSPSGKYRVDANSPDNQETGFNSFQSRFTYRLIHTENNETVWTREQPMGKPVALSDDSTVTIPSPDEASPVAIYVSDTGATAIRTAWDELIVISLTGQVKGKTDLLEDAFSKEENEKYVHDTTAGPFWAGLSAWYFITTLDGEYFVVRPWWGRRIVIDVAAGTPIRPGTTLTSDAKTRERHLALLALQGNDKTESKRLSIKTAAYLAGVLKIKQAIPLLKKLEKSDCIDSSVFDGLSLSDDLRSGVDPNSYSTFSHRQIAQLSLRRLGVAPASLPCHSFETIKNGISSPFIVPELTRQRFAAMSELKQDMPAEQVLALVGAPDFISHDEWSYDFDGDDACSLTLTFSGQRVVAIRRDAPLWKSGHVRDRELAY